MQSAASATRDAPAPAWPRRRRLILALVILTIALSATVRFASLNAFPGHVFDEYYYAHDAAALLRGDLGPRGAESWRPGDARSIAHPELGTLAIAAGIALLGDGPWRWRTPAALAGTLLIALVYPLARRLFLPPVWALAATVLAASDTMLIVEARLAVLDTFVALGSAACIYCALRASDSTYFARWAVLCGLAGGAAVASKWSGALAVVAALVIFALYARRLGLRRLIAGGAGVVALTVVVYVAGYAAYFLSGHSLADWLHLQRYMLGFNWGCAAACRSPRAPSPGSSTCTPSGTSSSRATPARPLISIGNPLLWWAAALALVVLGVQALVRRDLRLGLAPLLVALLYLPWLLTSRQAYIFYMTPVVPFLAILAATGLSRIVPGGARRRVRPKRWGSGAARSWRPPPSKWPGWAKACWERRAERSGAARRGRRRRAGRGCRDRRRSQPGAPAGHRRGGGGGGGGGGVGLRGCHRRPRPGVAAVPAGLPNRLRVLPAPDLVRHLEVTVGGAWTVVLTPPAESSSLVAQRVLADDRRHDRLLRVQPVLGLVEHHRVGRVQPLLACVAAIGTACSAAMECTARVAGRR
jgi:dolichyl-phosphate-mannose-protein mannosyltransferase